MKKFFLPLFFLFLFLLDSLFIQFLPSNLLGQSRILVPRFLFVGLIFLTIFVGRKHGIIYAAIFGLLFDVVYIEVIGVYLFIFPFICYLAAKVMHVMQANIFIAILVAIVGTALLETGVYEMNYLIHVTNMDFMSFVNLRLYSTLILNTAFIIIFSYPLKRGFEKYAELLEDERL